MVQLLRVKSRWSGFNGAPGFTNLFFRDFNGTNTGEGDPDAGQAQSAADRVRTFWLGVRGYLPENVDITVEGDVDVVDSSTGDLVSSFGITAPGVVEGINPGPYSAASGAVINWRTSGIRNGRRVRGRTFVVPMSGALYSATGELATTARNGIQEAATALASNAGTPDLHIFGRPTAPGASDGVTFPVNSASVPAMIAVLRSRRD